MLRRTISFSPAYDQSFQASIAMAESALSLWWMGVETLAASWAVIAARAPVIDRAMRDPMNADAAELGRMVTEKMDAFTRASIDASANGWALYTDMVGQAMDMSRPGPASTARIAKRSRRMTRNTLNAGHKAIGPVHRTVTANRARLGGG